MKFKVGIFDVIITIAFIMLLIFVFRIGLIVERDKNQYKELWYECVEEKQNLRNKINGYDSDEPSEKGTYSAEEIRRRFNEVTED